MFCEVTVFSLRAERKGQEEKRMSRIKCTQNSLRRKEGEDRKEMVTTSLSLHFRHHLLLLFHGLLLLMFPAKDLSSCCCCQVFLPVIFFSCSLPSKSSSSSPLIPTHVQWVILSSFSRFPLFSASFRRVMRFYVDI